MTADITKKLQIFAFFKYIIAVIQDGRREVFRNLGLILQVGLTVIVPLVLLTFLGVYLDKKYGTGLTVLFVLLGLSGGAAGAWKLVTRSAGKKKAEEEETYDLMEGYSLSEDRKKEDPAHEEKAEKE